MPDPLSLTTGVLTIVGGTIKTLQAYTEIRAKYQAADLSILSAKVQLECIQTALGRIQETLLSRPTLAQRWSSEEQLSGKNLQDTLGACELTFAVIHEKLESLINVSVDRHGSASTKAKLSNLWASSEIAVALSHVSSLAAALNLLLTALNTRESQAEMEDILRSARTRSILSRVSSNAATIRLAREADSRDSNSEIMQPAPEDQDLDFDFDSFVLNSELYKKAFVAQKTKKPQKRLMLPEPIRYEHRYLGRVLADFEADPLHDDQVSVHRSETVEVSQIEKSWWLVRKDTGERGLVPKNFLNLYDARLTLYIGSKSIKSNDPKWWIHEPDTPIKVKAVFPYRANPLVSEELSFTKGEVLEVTEKVPGWWNAKRQDGMTGIVPSPYFVMAEDARLPSAYPPAFSPPPCCRSLSEESASHTPHQIVERQAPGQFDLLDNLDIARAVLDAHDSETLSDFYEEIDTETASSQMTLRENRINRKGKNRLGFSTTSSASSSRSLEDPSIDPEASFSALLERDPDRFVSQTEFQSLLMDFLRTSRINERAHAMPKSKLEAWIGWIMANPGDEELNVFEMYGLEDEIRTAVLPQLRHFENEDWGQRNTGAVLDAWAREAWKRGEVKESLLREWVRDLLTLWQDVTRLGPPPSQKPATPLFSWSSDAADMMGANGQTARPSNRENAKPHPDTTTGTTVGITRRHYRFKFSLYIRKLILNNSRKHNSF